MTAAKRPHSRRYTDVLAVAFCVSVLPSPDTSVVTVIISCPPILIER